MESGKNFLKENEYSILLTNSDFAINQNKKMMRLTSNKSIKKFCAHSSKAMQEYRIGNIQNSKKYWKEIITKKDFLEIHKLIATIKLVSINKNTLKNNSKLESVYKKINDQIVWEIYQIDNENKEKKAFAFQNLSKEFQKLNYMKLSLFCNAFYFGKEKYSSKKQTVEAHLKAAELYKKIGASDEYYQALMMNELMFVKDSPPNKAIELVKNALNFAKKGHAIDLYDYLKGNYYYRLGNREKNNRKKTIFYKKCSEHYSKLDNKIDYYSVMVDYYFTLGLIEKEKTKRIECLEQAVKFANKIGDKKKYQTMKGVYYLEKATLDPHLTNAAHFFRLSYQMFKKSGKTKSYLHTKALYYNVKHAFTSNIKKKILFAQKASKCFLLSGYIKQSHRLAGFALSWSIKLEKNFFKRIKIYESTAHEFKKAKDFTNFHLAKGNYFFFKAMFDRTPKSIDLWLKSADHFHKVKHVLEFEAAGKASFLIAFHTKSLKYASIAIELYKKTDNKTMIHGSLLVYYEIKAMKEKNEKKRRQYYLLAAEHLKKFFVVNMDSYKIRKHLPKTVLVPNMKIWIDTTYEHYIALGSSENHREEHFKNANDCFQKLIRLEGRKTAIMRKYAKLLQDWNKYDESYIILKNLSSKYGTNTSLKKEFALNENLLLNDYKNLKNDFIIKQSQSDFMKEMITTAIEKSKNRPKSQNSFQDYILQLLIEIGIEFESKSPTYKKFSEEELRDAFHSHLNISLKGRVTSESFRKNGHTDLHITNPENYVEIIILEFKLWNGVNYYHKGINQLLSYSTKRDDKTILITINKKLNWNQVLEKAKTASKIHPQFVSNSFKELELQNMKTSFSTKHNSPGRNKPLEIIHLLFDLSN